MKTNSNSEASPCPRAKYEPVSVKVTEVAPQGVLCASAASESAGGLGLSISAYSNGGTL